ncbi:MAG: hypothetical protein WC322_06995 [Candidatus Paceibacterota bacterium]|jgi:hypothetical protein
MPDYSITAWHVIAGLGYIGTIGVSVFTTVYSKRSINLPNELTTIRELIRVEIGKLYDKLSTNRESLLSEVKEHCTTSQASCNKLVTNEITHTREQLLSVAKKIEEVQQDKKYRWERQDDLNREIIDHIERSKG